MPSTPKRPSAELTSQQARAVTCRDVSIVLSSGAGCGKTHVLTERFLSHLRHDDVEVGQIVAITFTERAARQMRERIRRALRNELITASDADAERWAVHLRGLETAPISTIHAFCGNLLRQYAVEARLDPRFEILDGVLAANLEAEALTDCLQGLLVAQTPEGEDLRQAVLAFGWKPTLAAVRHLLQREDAPAWEKWLDRTPEQVAADWQCWTREVLLPRYARHVLATSKVGHCLKLLTRVAPLPGTAMAGQVARLLEETPRLSEAPDLAAAIEELVECAKVVKERDKAWPSKEIYEEVKAAFEDFRRELPARFARFTALGDDLAPAATMGQRLLRVARTAARTYTQYKRRSGVVDFQDLLVLTRDLLRDQEEVRERLQRRYRVLLIDELQDTDPVQVELVELLAGAGLTQGKLFAVGDHKQSIYRFRGADVHRFQELRGRVPQAGRLDLTVNFRSQPAILDFANLLLGRQLEDYEDLVAHQPQVNPGACVEFLWAPAVAKESVTESRSREAEWIARRIAGLIDGEDVVVDREDDARRLRRVRPGDVVLLFRSMSHVAIYETALRKHGLNYYLVGGRAFFAQQEVYDLLNLLRALENPQDAISLAGTLRGPFCCLSDEALFLLGRHADGLWAGLHADAAVAVLPDDQRTSAARARRFLDRWRSLKDRLSIARLLGELFADSGFDAATQFESLGDRKLANLWKLMELARTFDRSGLFGLAEFIARLGDLVAAQPREEQAATQPENADVVRLMTIHQAKGLEFPVVFIPDCAAKTGGAHLAAAHWDTRFGCVVRPPADEDPPAFSDAPWKLWEAAEQVEEWEEELRTLYVACTRAQDYLVLSATLSADFRPTNAWTTALVESFDPATGARRFSDVPARRVPKVRVTDDKSPPRDPGRTPLMRARSAELPDGAAAGIVTFAPSATGIRFLRIGADAATLEPVWDSEDGADLSFWRRPFDAQAAVDTSEAGVRDRLLRSVLERWDWQDGADGRKLLNVTFRADPHAGRFPSLRRELEQQLTAFADSELFGRLAGAVVCHRELEYVVPLDGGDHLARGTMDCLWQDEKGDWHLLVYLTDRAPSGDAEWRRREPGLALAAQAMQTALGAGPADVTRYCFATASTVVHGVVRA